MIVTTANSVIEPPIGDSDSAAKNISPSCASRSESWPQSASNRARNQPRRDKRDVHGWVVLDKPIGMTSTHAVAVVKRLFQAKRAGHAGTLDPLASGGLPIAMGEATKTVPFVMDGRKRYRFTVCWGEERDTDDTEGRVTQTSETRPSAAAILRPAAAIYRPDRTDPAAIFRHQDPGRAGLRSGTRRRNRRVKAPAGRDLPFIPCRTIR